ncbi:hypothetical protein [Bacillus paralicheniformis]|uniref:hypothetical protein n=1 Tax=Bacillus paralicheniformis TaxID=1648923 RepID=UPI002DB8A405|nr:hypothetical protein [Bacillus paralicheniformis]MEC1087933.1 hypothetical protein [Bacillus paralicheniformis]MEC1112560.1 hypothetical protein [Bacillus paralicheniformis]MEC1149767.1 hypothetical protein [Bacillus paralicheniformis]MEC1172139.1 hypothetical protein [Bacillus paralicheniformis]MEC1175344.1 hypothetical protein [Bacillus paralicheniformis]
MKSKIKKHLFELLTKEEVDIDWWDKYLDLLFEFRKAKAEALAQKAAPANSAADSAAESNEQPVETTEVLPKESSTNVNSKNEVLDELSTSFEEMNNKIIESNNKVLEAIKESLPENYTLPNDATLNFFKTLDQTKTE